MMQLLQKSEDAVCGWLRGIDAAHRDGSGGAVHAAGPWVRLHEPVSQP